jgi:hypothetical protein
MAEVQRTTLSGELTQRFIEFVVMHAQNAALFLGQIPNPKTGEAEVNLELARMFIDQLEMIQEKTRGNLTNEESTVLRNTLSSLQMAFVEASGGSGGRPEPARRDEGAPPSVEQPQTPPPTSQQHTGGPSSAAPAASAPIASSESESESRKKFSKSYGP